MEQAQTIIQTLTEAAAHVEYADVRAAYHTLIEAIAARLGGDLPPDMPLTEPQLVFIGYALRRLRAGQIATLAPHVRALRNALHARQTRGDALIRSVAPSAILDPATGIVPRARTRAEPLEEVTIHVPDPAPAQRPDTLPEVPAPHFPFPRENVFVRQHIKTVGEGGSLVMVGVQRSPAAPVPPLVTASGDEDAPDAPPMPEYDIFLSYSRATSPKMRRVRSDLEALGYTVWTDQNLTPGGGSWQSAIDDAIAKSKCMVVLLSPEAKKSEWVQKELEAARVRKLPIIPLLAKGDEKTAIPFALNGYEWADIRDDGKYRAGMRRATQGIRRAIGKR